MEAFVPLQVKMASLTAQLAAAEHGLREAQPDMARAHAVMGELRAGIREAAPLLHELMARLARLEMAGDETVRQAAARLMAATGELLGGIEAGTGIEAQRVSALRDEIIGLRRARDAAAAPWWKRRKMRRRVTGG
jgi:hypothetical protein